VICTYLGSLVSYFVRYQKLSLEVGDIPKMQGWVLLWAHPKPYFANAPTLKLYLLYQNEVSIDVESA
jgi:hypothetical protein